MPEITKEELIASGIKTVITHLMDNVLKRVLQTDPFISEKHHSAKPLYAALVPDEIFKGSHFERRFVTPFGGVWEKLAKVVAQQQHGHCEIGKKLSGTIKQGRLTRIQEVLNNLEHSKGKGSNRSNWSKELAYILQGTGELIPVEVVCDIYIESSLTNEKYAFELKAPLPNSDQTKVSKEKMFKLLAMEQPIVNAAYYALVYNPYGEKQNYAWSFPMRWFDMHNDVSVLIGEEFWNLIGGPDTYKTFINIINNLGESYKERIYREFLEIEPTKANLGVLK